MKIKREKLFNLLNVFETVKDLAGRKFAYAVLKNKEKIINEIKTFNTENAPKSSKEYQEWEQGRMNACNKHCATCNGKPVIKDKKFVGLKGNEEFEKAIEELKNKYKVVLEAYQKQVNEYNAKINEEIEFEIHQIDKEEVPEKISPKQLEDIKAMVKE